jgi:hypothetical protein
LERSHKQQQDRVEAEQSQQAANANRLAAAVAYRKVNLQIAGLQDYQSVFEGVVDYVCCAMGVAARAAAEPAARAQVSAAVESAFPLSGVSYFLTLPAQERLQQVRSNLKVFACRTMIDRASRFVVHVWATMSSACVEERLSRGSKLREDSRRNMFGSNLMVLTWFVLHAWAVPCSA